MGRLTFCPLRFFYIRLFFRAVSGSQQKRAEGTESPSIALPDTCAARPVVHALHHVAHLLQLTNPRLRLNAPVQRCGIPGTQGALSKKIMTMATSPANRAVHCHLTSSARPRESLVSGRRPCRVQRGLSRSSPFLASARDALERLGILLL